MKTHNKPPSPTRQSPPGWVVTHRRAARRRTREGSAAALASPGGPGVSVHAWVMVCRGVKWVRAAVLVLVACASCWLSGCCEKLCASFWCSHAFVSFVLPCSDVRGSPVWPFQKANNYFCAPPAVLCVFFFVFFGGFFCIKNARKTLMRHGGR